MATNIRQHLANLSGESVRDFNYSKLASQFGNLVEKRASYDLQNEIEYERGRTLSEPHIDMMRRVISEAIEKESAEMNGTLPIISLFEASQMAKNASQNSSRDVGLLNLSTHLERRWKAHREAHLTVAELFKLKDHYSRNFPKSKASAVIENFTEAGYMDLPVGDLMDIAAQIQSQDDYDYVIKEAGLHTNNPYNKKARKFILALLNGSRTAQSDFSRDVEEMRHALSDVGLYYDASVAESTLRSEVEDPENWVMIQGYKDMMPYYDESNMRAILNDLQEKYSNYTQNIRGEVAVKVVENGDTTPAFGYLTEIIAALSDYPILDDEDVSQQEYDAQLESISDNGFRFVDEEVAPEDWPEKVFSWLWENDQRSLDLVDDSPYVDDSAVRQALEALGWAYKDQDEDEDDFDAQSFLGY